MKMKSQKHAVAPLYGQPRNRRSGDKLLYKTDDKNSLEIFKSV